ncbi:MAG: hypothetical protein KDK64_00200, partial [Chlamydiia bacterium]|nr:hypothetical protein [Chlamydiia bacterium]
MDIKASTPPNARTSDSRKEERKLPTRSFKEVMAQKETPRFPKRGKSIFDLAAKENKKAEEKENPQAAPETQEIAPVVVMEGMEISEVIPVEISSLVEAMADYIKIESENGISKTTVEVRMKGTFFEGSQIEINHYDTAPQSFNLQLIGNPEALELFLNHLGTLQLSLNTHEALKGFQIHLMTPILKSERSELYARGKTR